MSSFMLCKHMHAHMYVRMRTHTHTWHNVSQFAQADASNLHIQLTNHAL